MPRRVAASWSLPILSVLVIGLLAADRPGGPTPRPESAGDLPLALREDFERNDRVDWEFTDPNAWRVVEQDGNHVLVQHQKSKYEPPVRSPVNLALALKADVGDMVLDVQARSTAPDTGDRDLCFVIGYRDPSHFYYVHLARQADEHHNNIFLVDGKPRVPIGETRTQGTPWDDGWHQVRVVRHVEDGLIQVFFDDMNTPAMIAHDKTLAHGRIGLGSFDDTGQFDDLQGSGAKRSDESREMRFTAKGAERQEKSSRENTIRKRGRIVFNPHSCLSQRVEQAAIERKAIASDRALKIIPATENRATG